MSRRSKKLKAISYRKQSALVVAKGIMQAKPGQPFDLSLLRRAAELLVELADDAAVLDLLELGVQPGGPLLKAFAPHLGDEAFGWAICRVNPDGEVETSGAFQTIREAAMDILSALNEEPPAPDPEQLN